MRHRCLALFAVLTFALLAAVAGVGASTAAAAGVTGHITDAVSGAPLPYATVVAYYANGDYYTSWYADAQGAYDIQLSDGAWKLRFIASYHVEEYWNDKPDKASADLMLVTGVPLTGADAALARSPQAHIRGKVVDGQTGDPIAGVEVMACDPALWNIGSYTYTAADGSYDLTVEPGSWGLCFDRFGYDRRYYEHLPTSTGATVFTLDDGDAETGVDEVMPRARVFLDGWAQTIDDAWLPGIEMRLLDASDGHTVRTAVTGADGTCTMELGDLLGGNFKVLQHDSAGVYADQYYGFTASGTTSFADAATITPALGSWYRFGSHLYDKRPGEIRGRTLDAAGHPVGGVSVWLGGSGGDTTVSDADGYYSLPGLHVSAASRFTVAFNQADQFGPYLPQFYDAAKYRDDATLVPVAPGQTVTVDSHLYKATTITGTVSGPNGPLSGIVVTLYDAAGERVSEATTWGPGTYAFPALWPGDYRLKFDDPSTWDADDLPGYQDIYSGGSQSLAGAAPIHVDGLSGESATYDVTLEPWGGVKVDAVSDIEPCPTVGGLDVTLYDSGFNAVATTNVRGAGGYIFPRLPLGTYYVSCTDPRGVYGGETYEDVTSLDRATPLVLTRAQSKAALVMHLTPVRGVSPDSGALPDGSTTTASLRLGIYPLAIASSGDTTFICGSGAGMENGCYVYERGDAGWARRALLTFPSTSGRAVDVDGDVAAVCGMDGPDHDLVNGKVYVYRRTAGVWGLEATLQPEQPARADGYGLSVAVSGETILVGAPDASYGGFTSEGAVHVYVHGASGWTQQALITPSEAFGHHYLGAHVALDGDRALVSMDSGNAVAVAVYERSAGSWQRTSLLVAPADVGTGAQYGAAVALQGDRALVGAPGQATETGAVYVFDKLAGGWALTGELAAADGQRNDRFGYAVDLQDDNVLAGAPGKGYAAFQYPDGAAYLFRDDGGAWRQDAEMQPVPGQSPANFGSCVALAGRDLFAGSPGELRADGRPGRVHVFSPYVTDVDTTFTADAGHGVLVNDVGPEGFVLSAELVTGPSHGSVQLGSDGSLVYVPAAGYVGGDEFTYRAVSGDWQSEPAAVTITVRGTSGPTLAAAGVPAGWVNVAPTVQLSATAPGGVAAIEYRADDAALWASYDAPIAITDEGVSEYATRSRDVFGNASAGGFTVKLDRQRPRPKASAASARRGKTCTLKYTVADAVPGSPTATVKIVVKDARGRQKWSGKQFAKPVNKALSCQFRCTLAAGTYRFYVYATDAAGNTQTAPASNKLTVR